MKLKAAAMSTKHFSKYLFQMMINEMELKYFFNILCTSFCVYFKRVQQDLLETTVAFRVAIPVLAISVRANATVTTPVATL